MRTIVPLLLVCSTLFYSCGGCDPQKHNAVWDDYRNEARKQKASVENGSVSKETLQARYYIHIMWRDLNSKKCDCPKESPSYMDRKQVFADQVDPICVLTLTKRYAVLMQDTTQDHNDIRKKEIDGIVQLLTWYSDAVGIGGVQSYDEYGTLMPVDTAIINKKVRDLSFRFNVSHTPATKVELIECPNP